MDLVEDLTEPGVSVVAACAALGVSRATLYRATAPSAPPTVRQRAPSPRKLNDDERQAIVDVMHAPEFVDQPPMEVFAKLLSRGLYLASIRTIYRVLAELGESKERRNQRLPHPHVKPSLTATAPNQVWTWDITKLATLERGVFLHAYVIIDLFSRYVVGWMVAAKECKHLAAQLFAKGVQNPGRFENGPLSKAGSKDSRRVTFPSSHFENPGARAAPGHRGIAPTHCSLEAQGHVAPLGGLDEMTASHADRPARLLLIADQSDGNGRPLELPHVVQGLEGIEHRHVAAFHVRHPGSLQTAALLRRLLKRAVLLEDRVQMSYQQDSFPSMTGALGEEVAGAAHLWGHRNPLGLEAQGIELGLENPSHLAHTGGIHGAAIDSGHPLYQLMGFLGVLVDVVSDLLLHSGENSRRRVFLDSQRARACTETQHGEHRLQGIRQ